MIDVIADLHLHSKYSRAVSPQMTFSVMARVAKQKGIHLLGTGDFTHPLWFTEIQQNLEEAEEGLYRMKESVSGPHPDPLLKGEGNSGVSFLLSVEIATIFSQNGKGRRIHQLIFAPSIEIAAKINKALLKRGCNLSSDGRPMIGLSSKHLLELVLSVDERAMLIPAHVWTPWFGVYGQKSGFTSLEEAFEELAPHVYGIETGLSSDPEMNWQMDELKNRSILSFSDAHSPAKMGREATVFRLENLSYENIRQAIMRPGQGSFIASKAKQSHKNKIATSHAPRHDNKVLYTIEFYPEEGKYHYSGHRNCKVSMSPDAQLAAHNICPVCHRPLTDGVMRRVQELAKKEESGDHTTKSGLMWITDPHGIHPPFVKIVPLLEIIAEAIGSSVSSQKTKQMYERLCLDGTSEFHVLLFLPLADIERIAQGSTTAEKAKHLTDAIARVRGEHIVIVPGFDGVYGTVKIWPEDTDVAKNSDQPIAPAGQTAIKF